LNQFENLGCLNGVEDKGVLELEGLAGLNEACEPEYLQVTIISPGWTSSGAAQCGQATSFVIATKFNPSVVCGS